MNVEILVYARSAAYLFPSPLGRRVALLVGRLPRTVNTIGDNPLEPLPVLPQLSGKGGYACWLLTAGTTAIVIELYSCLKDIRTAPRREPLGGIT